MVHAHGQRVAWVDYAKGFCIIMVVMMHSTLGVEKAAGADGWMNYLVEFARPFRMPDFFMIAGLFLARVIDRDWRTYLDKKVVHFAYFYVLWLTIQFAFKAPGIAADSRRRRHAAGLCDRLHRALRHDLVHLSAADLLRRRQGDARRPVVDDLDRRRRARGRADQHRLDPHRRVRLPFRLFLHRLYLRAADLPDRRRGHRQRLAGRRLSRRMGAGQRLRGLCRRSPTFPASASDLA